MSDAVPYVLGHSDTELARLAAQARAIDPITRRFFTEAGVGVGMRVLDVGCGGGDVSVLVADLVGPSGSVVGFDRYEDAVQAARAKVQDLAIANVTFVSGTVAELADLGPFDAIVGRYVLQFVDDPDAFLTSLARLAKPGAPVVFHELDWSGVTSDPPVPSYDRLASWLETLIERSGANTHSGLSLPGVFAGAGLGDPELRIEQRAGAGSTSADVVERMVGLARSLADALVASGILGADELDLGTISDTIMAEAVARGSVLRSHLQVGAWVRRASSNPPEPLSHGFDKDYWEQHWQRVDSGAPGSMSASPPNPYLAPHTSDLVPGRALDAGCGAGAEAIWLAAAGWQVTAVDISSEALALAFRAATGGPVERLRWIEADLSVWEPDTQFDLVTTHYAHPAMPQLEFYDRIAEWVAPGGTLLIVGHLLSDSADHAHGHGSQPPAEASADAAAITARLDGNEWEIAAADEVHRTMNDPDGREATPHDHVTLHDVVVRAIRRRVDT